MVLTSCRSHSYAGSVRIISLCNWFDDPERDCLDVNKTLNLAKRLKVVKRSCKRNKTVF